MRFIVLAFAAFSVSCSQYRGMGDFQTAEQYGNYPRAHGLPKAAPREPGPFVLRWPLHDVRVTQGFSPMKNRRHQGVDFGGRKGTAIFAAHEGMVVYAGRDFRGYGKMVLIEYNNEWASLYAHLTKIVVREGQYVEPGQTIGTMGRTGRASGVHLHFELIQNKQPVDPLPLLAPTGKFTVHMPKGYSPSETSFNKHILYKRAEAAALETITE